MPSLVNERIRNLRKQRKYSQKYCKANELTEASLFEKLVLYAFRNLPKEEKQEVFELISKYIVL